MNADPGPADVDLLVRAYAAYNAQDLAGLLALVDPDVDWPEGPDRLGRLHGRAAVRAYWTEQWTRTHTHDEPVGFRSLAEEHGGRRVVVRIRQTVRGLDGAVLGADAFDHTHTIRGGRIVRMHIAAARSPDQGPA